MLRTFNTVTTPLVSMKNRSKAFSSSTMRVWSAVLLFNMFSLTTVAQQKGPVKFTKAPIASESFESVGVFDVNNDGKLDLVSGAYWYEGPDFWTKHLINQFTRYEGYYDDFSTVPFDVNGDGKMDFITGGWFEKTLRWYENPGDPKKLWTAHDIAKTTNIESTYGWDIDGDGIDEIIPNTPENPLLVFKYDPSTKTFAQHVIHDYQDHGIGIGDINGDGRKDLIVSKGWLEQPANPWKDKWIMHENEFDLKTASVPIVAADVNGDGLTDLISGVAHGYGLDWYEQKFNKKTKKRTWIKHTIDAHNSMYHCIMWTDIDGDGQPELITGKRYRAHDGRDPGEKDDIGLYYFKWNGETFSKNVISYGPYGVGKGAGLYFSVADLRGTGRKDIIVAGKDGLCVFYNEGNE